MIRYALKTALAKKVRLLSTALAVMLGIAFLSGTYVFTDTIQRTFDDLFADLYEETDAVVRSTNELDAGTGSSFRGRVDESVLARVAAVDGVAEASPMVSAYMQILDADGKPIGDPGRGAPTFGMNWIDSRVATWQLAEGVAPGPGQVAIDRGSATRGDLEVGDTITLLTQTGPHELELVGTVRFGSVDSPGGASISLLDLRDAQDLLVGHRGQLDSIWVDAEEGVTEDALRDRIAAVLHDDAEALTGTEITEETQQLIRDAFSFFATFLLVFAGIGLVVACFTIYNTFQIVVSQRTREMALLRAIGATRRQVLGAQLVEAALIGVLASVAGIVGGILVASGLKSLLDVLDIDVPGTGTVLRARTVVIGLAVGVIATTVSAVFPSLRASRVPPIAALRHVASPGTDLGRGRLAWGMVVTAGGAVSMGLGLSGGEIGLVGLGALLMFLGAFVLGPLLTRPAVRVMGAPATAVAGVLGELARENAARNPKRTARTGGALMVGVALVVAINVIAASARDWSHDVFDRSFHADLVVATNTFGFGGLSTDLAARLAELPEVRAASGVRVGMARIVGEDGGDDITYVAIDPDSGRQVFDIGIERGALAGLDEHGVMLDDGEAERRGLRLGDSLELTFLDGVTRTLLVQGIYTDDELAGPIVMSHALHEQTGVDQFDFSVYVMTAPGVSEAEAKAAIAPITDEYANAELQSRSEYIAAQAEPIDQIVNLMYGLLGLAIVIALLSIANSMILSIHERTRELGLLRAVGMTRGQTRRVVRWEAGMVALLGTVTGVVIGLFFGWSISVTLREDGGLGTFTVPYGSLVWVVVLAVLGGVLAAFRPARRAAKLDVLRAIATE